MTAVWSMYGHAEIPRDSSDIGSMDGWPDQSRKAYLAEALRADQFMWEAQRAIKAPTKPLGAEYFDGDTGQWKRAELEG